MGGARLVRAAALVSLGVLGLIVAAGSQVNPAAAVPGEQPSDPVKPALPLNWDRVLTVVPVELQKRDLLTWSDELAAKMDAARVEELLITLDVLVRAGEPRRVSAVIGRLGKTPAAERPSYEVLERLFRAGYYEQARLWFETFPKSHMVSDYRASFVDWLAAGEGAEGAEAWLRQRDRLEREESIYAARDWTYVLLRYLESRGTLAAHVEAMGQEVRKAPTDAGRVFEYLRARRFLPKEQRPALAWLVEIVRLEHPLDSFYLAWRLLSRSERSEDVIPFYDISLASTMTDYDRQRFNETELTNIYVAPEQVEPWLRRWTKAELAKACFAARRLDRAQKLVEELTGKKDGALEDIGPYLFAGQVQDASGLRVIEERIRKAEEVKKDSVRYWLNRAAYYKGRKEGKQAEDAYESALKLPPDSLRWEVVRDYGWFLKDSRRWDDAAKLYRGEIQRVGLESDGVAFWLHALRALDEGRPLPWDDPLIWDWLAIRKKRYFGQSEQGFLEGAGSMAREANAWDAFEKKARTLAAPPCPAGLQYTLGSLLHRFGSAEEGLRMMLEVYEQWPKDAYPFDYQVGERLLSLLLARGDGTRAGKIVDHLAKLGPDWNSARWFNRMAVEAAKGGAPDLAMELWRRKLALDLSDQADLGVLVSAGLADRLREFYAALARRAPANQAIAAALQKLKQ